MDDINFDELDKAVNTALQQSAPRATPAKEEPTTNTAQQPETPKSPTVVPQRRGQFMDMVHPSSDMTKQSVLQRTARQAPTLQPLNPEVVETTSSEPEASPSEVGPQPQAVSPSISEKIEDTEVHPATASEWPDPLDVMERTEEDKNDTGASQPEEYEAPTDMPQEKEPEDSNSSPFIPGAETEKRPLGAFTGVPQATNEESAEPSVDEPVAEHLPETETTSEELPSVPPMSVPEELSPEVVSVESDEPSKTPEKEQDDHEETPGDANGLAASISQQYKSVETPAEEQGEHPVFDTKDYHQPLTPPAKKSHVGLIVSLIFVILSLLGASAWYAIAVLKLI